MLKARIICVGFGVALAVAVVAAWMLAVAAGVAVICLGLYTGARLGRHLGHLSHTLTHRPPPRRHRRHWSHA